MARFEFTKEEDGSLSLSSAIHQALGAASVAWEHPGGGGVFNAEFAHEVGLRLEEFVRDEWTPGDD